MKFYSKIIYLTKKIFYLAQVRILFLIYSGYKLYRIDKQNCNNKLVKKIKETVIIFIVQVRL